MTKLFSILIMISITFIILVGTGKIMEIAVNDSDTNFKIAEKVRILGSRALESR